MCESKVQQISDAGQEMSGHEAIYAAQARSGWVRLDSEQHPAG